jgi:hypothetical protein
VQLSLNRGGATASGRQPPAGAAYVVYHSNEDALRCIQSVDGKIWCGKQVRACYGTTKYCHAFVKGVACTNPDCLYLHELGAKVSNRGRF